MNVQSIIGGKSPVVATIPQTATLREAVAQLTERRIGALVVSGDGKAIEELLPHSTVTQTVTLENVYPLLLENVVVSATAVAARGADDPALGTVRASSWTWLWSWTVLVILVVVALGITIWQVQRRRRKPGEWGPPEGLWRHSGAGSPAGKPPVEGERELSRHGGA